MCLSIAVHRPNDVLANGKHAGFEWVVVHNGMGYRCGYVKVPPGHPWHGVDYNELDCSVHGGLTFSEKDEPCDAPGPDDGYWVGFDCAHSGDDPDYTLPGSHHKMGGSLLGLRFGSVKDQTYVEAECRSLCEQAQNALVEIV